MKFIRRFVAEEKGSASLQLTLLVPVFLGVTMGSTDEVGAMLGKKLNKFQSSLEGQIAAPTGSSHFMGKAPGGTSGAKWIEVPSAGSVSDRIMAVVAG
ncbi:hypothetical protein [Pseudooceanicola atlanticus]|jgi:Flp pilus assembly pilin Flp|uniref:Uncharacterized protein n=1 Tax=Pseudooceanicola atlanticus TaxID=1461694 RepID=A0A0A0EFG4_9RHOB|nr:hypothetical protein [Pseudooceanicola atlanticus]KGM47922.1 hypothetical protein ATO9_15090 [Pseudooceanicola atlanticus]